MTKSKETAGTSSPMPVETAHGTAIEPTVKPADGLEVHRAIARVRGELAAKGIGKDRQASMGSAGSYKFRGIDDVYNALATLLAENNLNILPRVVGRETHERVTEKTYDNKTTKSVLFFVIVEVDYDFISAIDGSSYTVKMFGEAMDSGDKATNKALSAAYKYMCLQAFSIPTEGESVDSEKDTHGNIKPRTDTAPPKKQTPAPVKRSAIAPPATEPSVWPDASARTLFTANTIKAFTEALTEQDLAELKTLNQGKIFEARESQNSDDRIAGEQMHRAYLATKRKFAGEEPRTVEDTMTQQSGDAYDNDHPDYRA